MALLLLSGIVPIGYDGAPRVVRLGEPYVYLIGSNFLVCCMQGQEMDLLHSLTAFGHNMTRLAVSAFR